MFLRKLSKPEFQRNKSAFIGFIAFMIAFIVAISRGINDAFQADAKGYVGEALGMLEGWTYMQENPLLLSFQQLPDSYSIVREVTLLD